jgi:hypothetical protein
MKRSSTIGMPSGLVPPDAFGISTRRTGGPSRLANSPALQLAMPNALFGSLGLASVAASRPA